MWYCHCKKKRLTNTLIPRKRLSLPQNDNLSSISSACFSNSNRDSIVLVSELTAFVFPPINMELKRLLLLLFIPFFDTGSLTGSGGGGGGGGGVRIDTEGPPLCCTTAPSPRLCNRLSIDFVVIINIEKRFEEAYYHKIKPLLFCPFVFRLFADFPIAGESVAESWKELKYGQSWIQSIGASF